MPEADRGARPRSGRNTSLRVGQITGRCETGADPASGSADDVEGLQPAHLSAQRQVNLRQPQQDPTQRRALRGGKRGARHFDRRVDAQRWVDERTAALVSGTHVDLKTSRITVSDWCSTWLEGYGTRRPSTVRQANLHVAQIEAEFGPMQLGVVRPSQLKSWTAKLGEQGYAVSTVYAFDSRLSQIMSDAGARRDHSRSPCSRRTSPPRAKQRPYVATTEQVWALHDTMLEHLRAGILLGAFARLRIAEACGLRTDDVDFLRGVITPAFQYPAERLKTETSKTAIPVPRSCAPRCPRT